MYRLEMVVANIKHQSWWWNGKPICEFDDIDELIDFMIKHIPMTNEDINFIYNNDKKQKNGRLACTSWYSVEKGEHQMTEYTSF